MDGVEPAELEFLGLTEGATPPMLRDMFDDFCDSSALGMRYELYLHLLQLMLPLTSHIEQEA
jgi:hypothetical protein